LRQPVVAVADEEDAGVSFGETARGGMALVGEALRGFAHAVGSVFSVEREVIVKPE
jgi:hypothetical protein